MCFFVRCDSRLDVQCFRLGGMDAIRTLDNMLVGDKNVVLCIFLPNDFFSCTRRDFPFRCLFVELRILYICAFESVHFFLNSQILVLVAV